jgi:hypothetical protein
MKNACSDTINRTRPVPKGRIVVAIPSKEEMRRTERVSSGTTVVDRPTVDDVSWDELLYSLREMYFLQCGED